MSATVSYNCACDDSSNRRTLKSLRDEMLRRLGFGAQVDNPPPGMADLGSTAADSPNRSGPPLCQRLTG